MKPDKNGRMKVGWREWVALPALEIPAIRCKIDTGARSSSLHAYNIRLIREDGFDRVEFEVHPLHDNSRFVLRCKASMIDERKVRSSNGEITLRPFVTTTLALGGREWPIEVSLADRASMKFPMLLGREAMKGQLMVDPGRSYLQGRKLPRYYRDHGLPKKARPIRRAAATQGNNE